MWAYQMAPSVMRLISVAIHSALFHSQPVASHMSACVILDKRCHKNKNGNGNVFKYIISLFGRKGFCCVYLCIAFSKKGHVFCACECVLKRDRVCLLFINEHNRRILKCMRDHSIVYATELHRIRMNYV